MQRIDILLKKGVVIPHPSGVYIDDDIDLERIAKGVTLYPGCRIFGSDTLIMERAKLGYETPVTIHNCQIGPDVALNGGFFKEAVFLQGASTGSGAHVREGTILEEEASGAHNVGLKQTILFPYVTLGSLINFCDCLMSGGTGKKDHSEVGSSYIHFNFTPHQDKATASLLGDVPAGVMLRERPIFLGGQGGLVGPRRLAFGTVVAAGTICRKDERRPGRLISSPEGVKINTPFDLHARPQLKKIVQNNIHYVANLMALRQWYEHVRFRFFQGELGLALHRGLKEKLDMGIYERLKRLGELSSKVPEFKDDDESNQEQNQELFKRWGEAEGAFIRWIERSGDAELADPFFEIIDGSIRQKGRDYVAVIRGLSTKQAEIGTRWLRSIVDGVEADLFAVLPSFAPSSAIRI